MNIYLKALLLTVGIITALGIMCVIVLLFCSSQYGFQILLASILLGFIYVWSYMTIKVMGENNA